MVAEIEGLEISGAVAGNKILARAVFSVPIIVVLDLQDPAAVGMDDITVGIMPEFTVFHVTPHRIICTGSPLL